MSSQTDAPDRWNHTVPRFHLKRFADNELGLTARDRGQASVKRSAPVKTATSHRGFYDVPGPSGPSGEMETHLGNIENAAAPIIARLIDGGLLSITRVERLRLSAFFGLQIVRGIDFTNVALASILERDRLEVAASSNAAVSRVARPLNTPLDEESTAALSPEDGVRRARPPVWWLRIAAPREGIGLGEFFFSSRWTVVSADRPALITADRPLAMYREGAADGEPTGISTADLYIMPLSRTVTLLMQRNGFNFKRLWPTIGAASYAVRSIIAASSYQTIYHHPDDDALFEDLEVPPPAADVESEPFEFVSVGDTVRLRSRIIPSLPSPPRGWTVPII